MAIVYKASKRITGLASEKSSVSDAQTNSIFSETDTGDDYIWNGTAWVEVA